MTSINNDKPLPKVHDQKGNVAVWQNPNLPLAMWLVLNVISFIVTNEQLKNFLDHLGMAFLFTWAYLELTQGINYFRRTLGLIVLLGCIAWFVQITLSSG